MKKPKRQIVFLMATENRGWQPAIGTAVTIGGETFVLHEAETISGEVVRGFKVSCPITGALIATGNSAWSAVAEAKCVLEREGQVRLDIAREKTRLRAEEKCGPIPEFFPPFGGVSKAGVA